MPACAAPGRPCSAARLALYPPSAPAGSPTPPTVALRLASPCCVSAGLRPATPPPPRPDRPTPASPAGGGGGASSGWGRPWHAGCWVPAAPAALQTQLPLRGSQHASATSARSATTQPPCTRDMHTHTRPARRRPASPLTPANCCPGRPTRPPGACPSPSCCRFGARPPPAPSRCCAPSAAAWPPTAPCRPPIPGLRQGGMQTGRCATGWP